jgi:predicted protein tyrosine phosphatase
MITRSEQEAARILLEIRPEAVPHQKLVRFFDEELGCNLSAANSIIIRDTISRRTLL